MEMGAVYIRAERGPWGRVSWAPHIHRWGYGGRRGAVAWVSTACVAVMVANSAGVQWQRQYSGCVPQVATYVASRPTRCWTRLQ